MKRFTTLLTASTIALATALPAAALDLSAGGSASGSASGAVGGSSASAQSDASLNASVSTGGIAGALKSTAQGAVDAVSATVEASSDAAVEARANAQAEARAELGAALRAGAAVTAKGSSTIIGAVRETRERADGSIMVVVDLANSVSAVARSAAISVDGFTEVNGQLQLGLTEAELASQLEARAAASASN